MTTQAFTLKAYLERLIRERGGPVRVLVNGTCYHLRRVHQDFVLAWHDDGTGKPCPTEALLGLDLLRRSDVLVYPQAS